MSNLANKPPLGQKEPKKKKDAKFLNKVREQKCCVCERFGEAQISPTTAHHPIHDRHGFVKRSDGEAIPLCEGHHQGLCDNSKIAIHKEPKLWQETYGPDWSYSVQETAK